MTLSEYIDELDGSIRSLRDDARELEIFGDHGSARELRARAASLATVLMRLQGIQRASGETAARTDAATVTLTGAEAAEWHELYGGDLRLSVSGEIVEQDADGGYVGIGTETFRIVRDPEVPGGWDVEDLDWRTFPLAWAFILWIWEARS